MIMDHIVWITFDQINMLLQSRAEILIQVPKERREEQEGWTLIEPIAIVVDQTASTTGKGVLDGCGVNYSVGTRQKVAQSFSPSHISRHRNLLVPI